MTDSAMRKVVKLVWLALAVVVLSSSSKGFADGSDHAAAGSSKVESGVKVTAQGIKETAQGASRVVVDGARDARGRLVAASKRAEPEMKSGWRHFKESAIYLGRGIRNFFSGAAHNQSHRRMGAGRPEQATLPE